MARYYVKHDLRAADNRSRNAALSIVAAVFAVSAPALVGLLLWMRASGLRRDLRV